MTATTTERATESIASLAPARGSHPIAANTLIRKGWMVALDVNGRAVPANTIANGALVAVGKASHTLDNRTGSELGGAAGAAYLETEYGVFDWLSAGGGDAIAADDVSKVCYMLDNQTVALTSSTGARGPAGVISEVRNGRVYVHQGPTVAALINLIVALTA
jgi:hypothetical protein